MLEAGELAELLIAAHRPPLPAPHSPPLLQRRVVELALGLQQSLERRPLASGGPQEEATSSQHADKPTKGVRHQRGPLERTARNRARDPLTGPYVSEPTRRVAIEHDPAGAA